MSLGHRPPRRDAHTVPGRSRGETGAVIVEMAIVAVVLVMLLAGAFDYGQAWRVGLTANEAARTGARVGSGQATALTADFSLLSGMRSALESSGQLDHVVRVVIFRSESEDGRVPWQCTTGSGTGQRCNIFTGAQLNALPATSSGAIHPTTGCVTNSERQGYCPNARDNIQLHAHYLGIWVQVRYEHLFPILGSSTTITRTAVMRLEPKGTP
jgi:Flp pilus assembly protein TadG